MRSLLLCLFACMAFSGVANADVVVMQTTTTPDSTTTGNTAWNFTAAANSGFYKLWIGSNASASISGSFTIAVIGTSASWQVSTNGTLESNYMGLGQGYLFDLLPSGTGTLNIQNMAAGAYTFDVINTGGTSLRSFVAAPGITASQGFSSATFANTGIQFALVAVPEPGTLLLGTLAACSGGAGVWWKRRRRKPAQAETTDQPATA